MCSIFGIGFFKDHNLKSNSTITGIVSRFFKVAEINGRRASGLSIMREQTNDVIRRPIPGSELIAGGEYLDFMRDGLKNHVGGPNRLMSIIGHCRWPTQGSESNYLNNHPQVIDHIIGVHNGVISNDHQLFKSFENLITRKAQVDTEIIFQLIKHFSSRTGSRTIDAIRKATPYLGGGYACGMQSTHHPYNLYLFRHHNPIKIVYYPEMGVVFFATREHFITNAFEEFVENTDGTGKHIDLVENQGIVFNLWNKSFSKFLFRDKRAAEELGKHAG